MTDKNIAQKINQEKEPKTEQETQETHENAGTNQIIDFINQVSDRVSSDVADCLQAAIYSKSMEKLGLIEGPMTKAAKERIKNAYCNTLVNKLPMLTGANGHYLTGQ